LIKSMPLEKNTNQFLVGLCLVFLMSAQIAEAGFGISPPYVQNDSLVRNSYYEQSIWLGRSEADEEVRVEIEKSVPGANDWITIDKGSSFVLPKGKKQVPIIIGVRVPGDAEVGSYKGNIKVRVIPTGAKSQGQVSIVLGAQIDVDLDVLDKVIYDFKVWKVNIPDLEEGHKLLWLFFPGRISFTTEIENLGNIEVAPTKIVLEIYDTRGEGLLETLEATEMEKVPPFSTERITVNFPTRLPAGAYTANFQIFKGEEVIKKGRLPLSVLPYGTLPDYKGYGFAGLNFFDKASVVLVGLGAVLITGLSGYWIYRYWKKRRKT